MKILPNLARPAAKVAGARRANVDAKVKGKQPAESSKAVGKRKAVDSIGPEGKKPKGRTTGAANYSFEDMEALLEILAVLLPLGGKGWNTAGDEFCSWAEENNRPARTAKSLENKFKQVCFF